MVVSDRMREGLAGMSDVLEILADDGSTDSRMQLRERLAELEFAIEDQGWTRLTATLDREFSRPGIRNAIRISRLMYLSNPLIRNAVNVQANYVWGQGINIRARDAGINDVVQRFLDDRTNRREFTSPVARLMKEVQQQLASNQFLAMFTDPSTGRVKLRTIDVTEVDDIITNPDDNNEPWYYLRKWSAGQWDDQGFAWSPTGMQQTLYPDWQHPKLWGGQARPVNINGVTIQWDAPVYHIKTGGFDYMRFGVPEVFSALDWARAVKQDLEDYATIKKALTRFAWNVKRKGGKNAVAAAKGRLQSGIAAGSDSENQPPPVTGSTFLSGEGVDLQAIPKAGATLSPDEGRRLWLMTSAGVGLPETMLSGDSAQGSWATAKSLDRPTELKMRNRQELWKGILADIVNYVIDAAVLAPAGPLKGKLVTDKYTGEMHVVIGSPKSPTDRRLDIDFPSILEKDILTRIQAIVTSATLNGQAPAGTLRPETLTRMILTELGEDEVDEELAKMDFADQQPTAPPADAPAAAEVYRKQLRQVVDAIERTNRVSKEGIASLRGDFDRMANRMAERVMRQVKASAPRGVKREKRFRLEDRDGVKNVVTGISEVETPIEGGDGAS